VIQPGPTGSGKLINYSWKDPYTADPGVINKYCAGLITIPYSEIFGPPPVDLCHGTIVITKNTEMHLSADFSFSGSGSLGTFNLDGDYDTTVPSTRTFSGLTLGSYTVTETEATGFTLTGLTCTSTEGAGDTTMTNLSTRTATIDLDGGETVTCTFTNSVNTCTPPAVTTQPVNQVITYGQNASFTIAGTNYTSIQWQVNPGTGWSNISGATATTYTLTKPAVSLSGNQYRAVLTGDCTPAATSTAATLTVSQAPVTATAGSYSNTYDGAAHSPSACAVTGAYTGDLGCTNSPASVGPDVGSGAITPVVNGTGLTNYTITSVNGSWGITPAPMTANITIWDKAYDGTTAASIMNCTLNGVVSSASVTCDFSSASANFDNKNVGTDKPVSVTGLTLSGASAGNYSFSGTGSDTASILAIYIHGSFTADDKVYDGTTAATVHSRSLSASVSGDDLSLEGGTAIFSDKDVGLGKTVTLTGASLSGPDAGNYILEYVTTTTADITSATLTAGITAENKTYDGTANATVTGCMLTGVVNGENVTCDYASVIASFADKNVGEDKLVSATGLTLSGADKSNYSFIGTGSGTASITAIHITGSFTAEDKVYDGTTAATVPSRNLSGVLSEDDVNLTGGTATFNDKNVGEGKTVTLTGASLSGSDADNYILDSVATTNAEINKRRIGVGPISGQFKVYGDADPTLTYTVEGLGLALGDSFTGELSRFPGESVGFYEIRLGTLAINDGNVGNNYNLWFGIEVEFEIKAKHITGSFTADDKVYDGKTAATVIARSLSGALSGDDVSLVGGTATFSDKNVGTDKTVTLSGASLSGADVGNYVLDSLSTAIADIIAADPICSISGYNGVYDGNPHDASGSCTGIDDETLTGLDLGDTFTNVPGGIAYWTFTDETGNYANDSGNVEIVITEATPTCSINGYTGVYDGYPHGASGSCIGVKSETLTNLDLGATFTDVPGGTAYWTFIDGTGNYYDDSGSVEIVISKAAPTCIIDGYTGVYDGAPHGASGSCTGIKNEALTGLDLGGFFTNVPGGTAYWTFIDGTGNYYDDSGSVEIVIDKADPTCIIDGYISVYDGNPHGASGACTGVKEELLSTLNLGDSFTNVPGGTSNWTFIDSTGNYNDDAGSVKIVILKVILTITADNQTAQYSDATPPLTFNYSGFIGSESSDDLTTEPSCSTTREIMSPAGIYPITCAGGFDNNYIFSYTDGTFTVTKENAEVTYTGDTQVTTPKVGAKVGVIFAAVLEETQDSWLGIHLTRQTILFEVFNFGDESVASCTATIGNVVDGKGYGSCTLELAAADPYQVEISLVTNNFYKAPVESVVVLVNDPGTGMANGGGWLIDPNTDSRVSFGFTAKFLKNGRVQGNSLFIYRVTTDLSTILSDAPEGVRDYNWIIKSNAMQGLYIYDCIIETASGCKATITGKNTIQAVDRETGLLYSIGGNYQFQVDVIDNQDPGSSGTSPDQYAIRVWNKSGTYYELGNSYDDHGMLINPLDVAAGNIQVKAKK
jgi:hypothetical protein